MTSLSVNPVGGPWVVAIIAAVFVGLLFIGPNRRRTTPRQRRALAALRCVVIALFLFALLRPAIEFTDVRPESASIVLLVDVSRSMTVDDAFGGTTRYDALRKQLDAVAGQLAALRDASFDIRPYAFAHDVERRTIDASGKIELPESPDGNQSAIGAAIADVSDEAKGRILAALLFSDGAQRAYGERDAPPQVEAERFAAHGAPIYAFAFGGSGGEAADLAVTQLLAPDTAFVKTPVEVTGELRVQGFGGQQLKAQLLWEGADGAMSPVDSQIVDVALDASGQARVPLAFRHTPELAGEYKVSVLVDPVEGERVETNNALSTFVNIKKGGVKVLLLDGASRVGGGPLPEQRTVRWALATSPDMMLTREHLDYRAKDADARAQFKPGEFDVVLLLNVDADAFDDATWKAVADWVEKGGGLLMAGGEHSFGPGGFLSTAMRDVLPIEIGRAERQNFGEPMRTDMHLAGDVAIRPTRRGEGHWVMDLGSDENGKRAWTDIPPLDGANRFDPNGIKPGALVLAESGDERRSPLLVNGNWGAGRVLAFAGDSTEKWRRFGLEDATRRFWRQVVLWLAKKDEAEEGEVWVNLNRRTLSLGENASFVVGAKSAQGEPIANATFTAEVESPDGEKRTIELTRRAGETSGEVRGLDATGDYRVRVTATLEGAAIGTAETRFLVEDHDLELDSPAADPDLLARVARETESAGGALLPPEKLPELLDELAARKSEMEQEFTRRVTLWDQWPFFLALVGALSLEWFLRKKWGLV